MPDLTLYQAEDDLKTWADTLDCAATEEERQEIAARIPDVLTAAIEKRDRFCAFLAHLEAQEELCKVEEDRIAARRRGFESLRKRLEEYAIHTMENLGVRKLEGNTSVLRLHGKPASVIIENPAEIPARFIVEKIVSDPDKRAIKAAIDAGEDVPGATLALGGNSLRRK